MIFNTSVCTAQNDVMISELERRWLQSSSAKSQWRISGWFSAYIVSRRNSGNACYYLVRNLPSFCYVKIWKLNYTQP